MAQDLVTHGPRHGELLVVIENHGAVPAAMVGDLLKAISADYRSLYRRTIVISRVAMGSIELNLTDAMDVIDAAKPYLSDATTVIKTGSQIYSFAKRIREFLIKRKVAAHADNPSAVSTTGEPHRTIEAMAKIAAETGSPFRASYRSPDGGVLEVELNQSEAVAMRKAADLAKDQLEVSRRSAPAPTQTFGQHSIGPMADRFDDLARLPSAESHPMIAITVRMLQDAGVSYLVEILASELESRGHSGLAAAVRSEASAGSAGAIRQTT